MPRQSMPPSAQRLPKAPTSPGVKPQVLSEAHKALHDLPVTTPALSLTHSAPAILFSAMSPQKR